MVDDIQEVEVSKELKQIKQELELTSENRDRIMLQTENLQQMITEKKKLMEEFIKKQQDLDHKINKTIPSSQ